MLGKILTPIHLYKVANWLYRHKCNSIAYLVSYVNFLLTGCQLPAEATIGCGVRFPDLGAGVVLNKTTVIGDNCTILPHAVLGQNVRIGGAVEGQIIVGKGVVIGAGAKVIATGVLTIGDNAAIGANAVVLRSVPANCLAVGVPARIIRQPE